MDFDVNVTYTTEQEDFRQEVRAWLEENIPEEMKDPIDGRDFTDEQFNWWREKIKEVAAKGWLYPTFPKEYGGGALTAEYDTILEEEFTRHQIPRRFGGALLPPCLLARIAVFQC